MRIRPPTLVSLAVLLALGAALPAAPTETPTPAGDVPPGLPPPELQLRAATARVRDLLTTWDAHELGLADVRRELAATSDRTRSLALEREIERLKFEADLEMLSIQAQYARREGRVELAEQLEGAVARLAAQRASAEPNSAARPAPVELVAPAGGRP